MPDYIRKYVYKQDYEEVMSWAKLKELRGPNYKENFPYFLHEYLQAMDKELKKQGGH
jgi:hypothetical protein